jgi:hypothetical protein
MKPTTPERLDSNKAAFTDQEKCEMLALHLENGFQNRKTIFPIDIEVHNTTDNYHRRNIKSEVVSQNKRVVFNMYL